MGISADMKDRVRDRQLVKKGEAKQYKWTK